MYMQFKDFITRQRVGIFVVGIATFVVSLFIAHKRGYNTLWGELFVDLAASAVTVIFTALIIDYLGVREEGNKTKSAAGLAEDEIKATCFRIKWRMARLFGLERREMARDNISNREQAREYLDRAEKEVDSYLENNAVANKSTPIVDAQFPRYLERLETARTELEQTLMLYEYAMSYSLRERVLSLRSELQVADNVLGFIDYSGELSQANSSLIRVLSQSIYQAVEEVLEHDSRTALGVPLYAKDSHVL
jgi:exonuclease VII small subunit